MQDAKAHGVPIVCTRWVRTRGSVGDIVDVKGHWTEFVASADEPFIRELERGDVELNTAFSDAFAPLPSELQREEDDDPTSLQSILEYHGASTLILAGTWAESCVERTAYSACTKGYVPVVVQPAIGGHLVAPTLARMDIIYAHVVEEVMFEKGR